MTEPVVIKTFGLVDVQIRKETFRKRAAKMRNDARKLEQKAEDTLALADKLDALNSECIRKSTQLSQQGKIPIDGKQAKAFIDRGLGPVGGVEKVNTKLVATNNKVALEPMYWAYDWLVDMLESMLHLPPKLRTEFYKEAQKCESKEDLLSLGGMILLQKMGTNDG